MDCCWKILGHLAIARVVLLLPTTWVDILDLTLVNRLDSEPGLYLLTSCSAVWIKQEDSRWVNAMVV